MNGRLLTLGACLATVTVGALWLGRTLQPVSPVTLGANQPNTCRLPVYLATSKIGGFLDVPGYRFTPDPSAPSGSRSYDAPVHKWLPAEPRLVSADGNWWAYQTPTTTGPAAIHVVDRHGIDRTVWSGTGIASLVGWAKAGAVFVHLSPDQHNVAEFWLVEVPSLTLRKVPSAKGDPVGVDAAGGIWTTRDQLTGPATDNNAPVRWTLSRMEMETGSTVVWLDQTIPGLVQLLGFDVHQHPILRILPDAAYHDRVVVLTAPKTETEITSDAAAVNFSPSTTLADQHGIWFGDPESSVWQWTPENGLQRLAQLPSRIRDRVDYAAIAGLCS